MSEFYKKLIKVQSTLNAPKNQFNSFGKYNYRSCEDIMGALKPLLAAEGLFQFITDDVEVIGNRHYVKATVTVTDGEVSVSNSALAREDESKKGMDGSQVTGAASSYARKYALNGMWNIDDSKDADTNEFREQQARQATQSVNNSRMRDKELRFVFVLKFKLFEQKNNQMIYVLTKKMIVPNLRILVNYQKTMKKRYKMRIL